MKQNQLSDPQVPKLKPTDLANIFNIYYNDDLKYTYNLLSRFYIPSDLSKQLYTAVFPVKNEYLTQFSYRMYKSIDYAWILAEINEIDNMLEPLSPDIPLKVPRAEVIKLVISTIQSL